MLEVDLNSEPDVRLYNESGYSCENNGFYVRLHKSTPLNKRLDLNNHLVQFISKRFFVLVHLVLSLISTSLERT